MKFIGSLVVKLSYYSLRPFNPPFLRPHSRHSAAGDDRSHAFSSKSSRRKYEDNKKVLKIAVWWDFENCRIPKGVSAHLVGNRISSAIRSSGIEGPVTINAFGDAAIFSHDAQKAITSTGICLTDVPHCGKNSADRCILDDMVCWVSKNPPPAHIFLISGDRDFAGILHMLRKKNYNILISCTGTASGVLLSAAAVMWPWSGLVKGENVVAKQFNYPPDGLDGSWYGHYEGVLDNPTTWQPEESMEPNSVPKIRPIPKEVVKGILQVLHSYPEGISLPALRTELKRNNITIDKDFYGHKYFSQFLGALNLLKAMPRPAGGGQLGPLKKGAEQPGVMHSIKA